MAILCVIVSHASLKFNHVGMIGVDIFFVLSGFLITTLLLEEWKAFGQVSMRAFYVRRGLRLLPALLAMLTLTVVWHALSAPRHVALRTLSDVFIALFYCSNWALALGFRGPAHVFAHTWTLSIEEQFYLLWPVLLILLLRKRESLKTASFWLMLFVFLLFMEKVFLLATCPLESRGGLPVQPMPASTLYSSAAFSLCFVFGGLWERGTRVRRLSGNLACLLAIPGLVFARNYSKLPMEIYLCVIHLVIGLCAVVILTDLIANEEGNLNRFLSQRWLVYIGKISYGLYLWHLPVFLEIQARHFRPSLEVCLELLLTLSLTLLSFYVIEQPALRMKARLGRRHQGAQIL